MNAPQHITHPWQPTADAASRVLILGTMPSPRSREQGFYYGHPQNVFWRELARTLRVAEPGASVAERTAFCHAQHVALWDVLQACDIVGASDASIKNAEPNRFAPLLAASPIEAIFTTGKTATRYFNKLCAQEAGMRSIYLPSTSPANVGYRKTADYARRWAAVGQLMRGELSVEELRELG